MKMYNATYDYKSVTIKTVNLRCGGKLKYLCQNFNKIWWFNENGLQQKSNDRMFSVTDSYSSSCINTCIKYASNFCN